MKILPCPLQTVRLLPLSDWSARVECGLRLHVLILILHHHDDIIGSVGRYNCFSHNQTWRLSGYITEGIPVRGIPLPQPDTHITLHTNITVHTQILHMHHTTHTHTHKYCTQTQHIANRHITLHTPSHCTQQHTAHTIHTHTHIHTK